MASTASSNTAAVPPGSGPSVAYLLSQYPKLSEVFVLREVLGLRRLGFRVETASVNSNDRPSDALTADEATEVAATHYLKAQGVVGAAKAHVVTLATDPAGWFRGMRLALSLGGFDVQRLAKTIAYFTEAVMVGRWMKRRGLVHVHAHLGSQAATVALFTKVVFGTGFSMTVHGPDEFYDAFGQHLPRKIVAADFIVCISNFARSQLMNLSAYEHWHKLVVSRLGIDPSVFRPRAQRPATPGPVEPEVFEVLCVGRLTPAKGQHLLVDAVARLAREGRSIRLRLVGDGPDRASLDQHVHELGMAGTIVLEGPVNQDRIREFYAAADCFAIASFAEGIPVVLMEAMAMEIPCVTTHITGIPELIRNGEDGLLVAPSDTDGLVTALARLMDDPAERERIGRNGRMQVMERYDLMRNVGTLAEIFRERLPS